MNPSTINLCSKARGDGGGGGVPVSHIHAPEVTSHISARKMRTCRWEAPVEIVKLSPLSYGIGGDVKWFDHWGNFWQLLTKLNNYLFYDSVIPRNVSQRN